MVIQKQKNKNPLKLLILMLFKKQIPKNSYLFFLGIAIVVFQIFYFWSFKVDDAFISFRYAQNLKEVGSLSWNYDNIPTFGFSNYLLVIISTLILFLNFDLLISIKIISICAILLSIIYSIKLMKLITLKEDNYFIIIGLIIPLFPYFLLHANSGLETILFTSLIVMANFYYVKNLNRYNEKNYSFLIKFCIIICLLVVCRYEGIFIYISFLFHKTLLIKDKLFENIKVKRFFPLFYENIKQIGIYFVPVFLFLALLIFNEIYFGQILPNPFYMKKNYDFLISFKIIFFDYLIKHLGLFTLTSLVIIKEWINNPKINLFFIETAFFLIPLLIISQSMNYFFRFYYPITINILLLGLYSFHIAFYKKESNLFTLNRKIMIFIICSFFFLSVLRIYFDTNQKVFVLSIIILFFSFLITIKKMIEKKEAKYSSILLILIVSSNFLTDFQTCKNYAIKNGKSLDECHIKIGKIFGTYPEFSNRKIAIIYDAGAIPYYSHWKIFDFYLNTPNDKNFSKKLDVNELFVEAPDVIIISCYQNIISENICISVENKIKYYNKTIIINELWRYAYSKELILDSRFKNFNFISIYEYHPSRYYQYIFFENNFLNQSQSLLKDLQNNSTLI